MGFFHGRRPSPEGEGKDKNSPQEHKPTPDATRTPTPDPDPTLPGFTVDCFGSGARFAISTQATGPGPIGNALGGHDMHIPGIPIHIPIPALAPNPGDVPNVLGLSERVTQPVPGVNVNNYQAVLDSLRKAREYMSNSATDSNELQNQDQVIECFENFCKGQGWPVFSAESR